MAFTVGMSGAGGSNADTVDGFHASQTPGANIIVPLNADGVLDLSATYVKSNVYSFRRVDLTGATSDYMLQVGEEAYISFSNATSVPLHIATASGTVYEMLMPGGGQPTYLNPNNTTYSSQFKTFRIFVYWNGSSYIIGSGGDSVSAFGMYAEIKQYLIFNDTNNKRILGRYGDVNGQHIGISGSYWNDITTAWTSLGTIVFPYPYSGYILVRRLV